MLKEFRKEMAPEFSFLSFNPLHLLNCMRFDFPKTGSKRIYVYLQSQSTLASVQDNDQSAVIQVHSVLNHPHTPKEVMMFIFRHELLHLEILPRVIEGKSTSHPPEFWDAERALCPERTIAWIWLKLVLSACLKLDRKRECTYVKSNWKRLMSTDRPTLEQVAEMVSLGNTTEKEEEDPIP
jgi:hypothetical protein